MLGLIALLQALTLVVSGPETSLEYLPIHVARAFGDFEQEGLAVDIRDAADAARAARTLVEPGAVLAATTVDAAIRSGVSAQGRPPRLVFGLTAAPPAALLVRAEDAQRLRSINDLAGLRVGLSAPGSPDHAWLLALLARSRLKVYQIRLESVGTRRLAAALESGELMAALVPQPTASALIADGRASVLADLRTPGAAAAALDVPTVNAGLFVRVGTQVSDAALEAVARALLRAEQRLATGSTATLAERLPPRVAASDLEKRVDASRALYVRNGLVTAKAMEATVKLLGARTPFGRKVIIPLPQDLLHLGPLRRVLGSSEHSADPRTIVSRPLSLPRP